MAGTSETLWTDFNGRKLGAERAVKDAKGRNLADNIDKIPSTYVSGAALSNNNKTLTLTVTDQSTSPATTSTVAITAALFEGVATTDYPDAPTKVAVYTRANLPSAANRDATTIYLVKEEA